MDIVLGSAWLFSSAAAGLNNNCVCDEIIWFGCIDCGTFNRVPFSTNPIQNATTKRLQLKEQLVVECEALFGNLDKGNCGTNLSNCGIGWNVRPLKTANQLVNIYDDPTQRVYAVTTQWVDSSVGFCRVILYRMHNTFDFIQYIIIDILRDSSSVAHLVELWA